MSSTFPGYHLNQEYVMTPKSDDIRINFKKLVKQLLTETSAIENLEEFADKLFGDRHAKFLDGEVDMQPEHRVIFTSVPRSGNSFLRKYFEEISGVVTGSDVTVSQLPNLMLQQIGFKGEETVDNGVWICKSHYPLTLTDDLPQLANRVICCVRNPIDVIVSEFNFMLTWTHN